MARRSRKNNVGRLLEDGESPAVKRLVGYGRTFPAMPGITHSPRSIAPSAIRVVLAYTARTSFTTSAGSTVSQVFTGNGLFDPDVTGVGSQPLGFDQWSAFYQKNRVLASRIEVNTSAPDISTNDQGNYWLVLVPSVVSTTFTSIDSASSSPYAKTRIVNGVSVPTQRAQLTCDAATDEVLGLTKQGVLSDNTLSGTPSANPSDLWYWHIMAQNSDGASGATIFLNVRIYYLVDFWDMNLLAQSSLLTPMKELTGREPQHCTSCACKTCTKKPSVLRVQGRKGNSQSSGDASAPSSGG